MFHPVARVVESDHVFFRAEAEEAVKKLQASGFNMKTPSIVARNPHVGSEYRYDDVVVGLHLYSLPDTIPALRRARMWRAGQRTELPCPVS